MSTVESYKVLGLLGRGGFGAVYHARFLGEGGFSKDVALKVLRPNDRFAQEVEQRLRDEARMLGLLRHRCIVQVDRLIQLDRRWVVVMEYVEGFDLREALRLEALPPAIALEIVAEVAGALHAATTRRGPDGPMRLLHRDIKPGNIRITPYGDVKVLDFGIARAEFASREARTQNISLGSPDYMAPERFALQDSAAGDVYALGVLLWECILRRKLGRTRPREEHHAAKMAEALQSLAQVPGLPYAVVNLVREATLFDPENRPTARDFERRARTLMREVRGPLICDWAESTLPRARAGRGPHQPDEEPLLGSTIEVAGNAGRLSLPPIPSAPEPAHEPPSEVPTLTPGNQRPELPRPPTPMLELPPPLEPRGDSRLAVGLGALALLVACLAVVLVGLQGRKPPPEDEPEPAARAVELPPEAPPGPSEPRELGEETEGERHPGPEPEAETGTGTAPRASEPRAAPSPAVAAPPRRSARQRPVETGLDTAEEARLDASFEATEEAPAEAPPPSERWRVDGGGDADWIELEGAAGEFRLPALAPAGRYRVRAAFPNQEPEVYLTVDLAGPTTVHCTELLRSCSLR